MSNIRWRRLGAAAVSGSLLAVSGVSPAWADDWPKVEDKPGCARLTVIPSSKGVGYSMDVHASRVVRHEVHISVGAHTSPIKSMRSDFYEVSLSGTYWVEVRAHVIRVGFPTWCTVTVTGSWSS